MSKFTVSIVEFRPYARNTLQGFASVRLPELGLVIKEVAIHQLGWVGLPGKPRISDDQVVKENGKVVYSALLAWDSRRIADAFSERVIEALDDHRMRQPA